MDLSHTCTETNNNLTCSLDSFQTNPRTSRFEQHYDHKEARVTTFLNIVSGGMYEAVWDRHIWSFSNEENRVSKRDASNVESARK